MGSISRLARKLRPANGKRNRNKSSANKANLNINVRPNELEAVAVAGAGAGAGAGGDWIALGDREISHRTGQDRTAGSKMLRVPGSLSMFTLFLPLFVLAI